jgi:hypothetical protein
MNKNFVSYEHFCSTLPQDRIRAICEQLYNATMSIPTKEIWTDYSMDTILRLLEYYYEIGAFDSKDTVLRLFDQLFGLLDTLQQYTNDGYKGGELFGDTHGSTMLTNHGSTMLTNHQTKSPALVYYCSVNVENFFFVVEKR